MTIIEWLYFDSVSAESFFIITAQNKNRTTRRNHPDYLSDETRYVSLPEGLPNSVSHQNFSPAHTSGSAQAAHIPVKLSLCRLYYIASLD